MSKVLNIVLLSVCALQVADAISHFRGPSDTSLGSVGVDQHASEAVLLFGARANTVARVIAGIKWMLLWIGAAVGAVVGGSLTYIALKPRAPKDAEEEEGDADPASPLEEIEKIIEEEAKSADAQALFQVLVKKVADDVGPKLEPGGPIRNVLEARASNFQDKAKNLLMSEMNSTAEEVLKELEAPESVMLLEWNSTVEKNFPPASILLAGALTPACLKLMSFHHLLQFVTVGLPVFVLCVVAIIVDWSSPCVAIPTIFGWLFTQTLLAACLFIGHGFLFLKIAAAKAKLAEREEENSKNAGYSPSAMRDQFVGQTVLLQEALLLEQDVRGSIWNHIVGAATSAWIITTIWNLVLVAGWIFVPGAVAFHPKAAKVAPDVYCGAWMTALVLKVNILLAALYFFFNLGSVVQWICDLMIESKAFQSVVLKHAQKMDAGGLPVVEMLVKALLFRGGSETLGSRLAVAHHRRLVLEKKQRELGNKQASLGREIEWKSAVEEAMTAKAQKDGGDLAAQLTQLSEGAVSFDDWTVHGRKAIQEAEAKATDVQEASTKALEDLYEKVSKLVDAAQNTEAAALLKAKAKEAEAAAKKGMADAQELAQKANDPEFQKQLQEAANKKMKEAQAAAEQAKAAAQDVAEQAKSAGQEAASQAQSAAEQARSAGQEAANQAKSAADEAAKDASASAKKAVGKK